MSEKQNSSRELSKENYFFRASSEDFRKIPGSPIAYWPSQQLRNSFSEHKSLADVAKPRQGLATTDNDRFLRFWFECAEGNTALPASSRSDAKWYPCQKGGGFRKWYGNNNYLVNWENDGKEIKEIVEARYGSASKRVVNEHLYFKEGITWSSLSSAALSMRYVPTGFIFETKGSMCFFEDEQILLQSLGFCNSSIVNPLLQCISPTLDYHEGPIGTLPISKSIDARVLKGCKEAIANSKCDWDSYETSWDFANLPLLHPDHHKPTLKASYQKLRTYWREMTLGMQGLERENNRVFIDAYGLQSELTPEVPINEITLTCNPHYRYGSDKSEEELEALLLADTMRELVSYAVGCMLGRYSLDMPGLILANQGETSADYLEKHRSAQVKHPSFSADDDNVIPVLDGDWFADDITLRLRQFLRVAFGEAHYEDNLAFIEQVLNVKGRRNFSLRDYFLGEFYADHWKRYNRRPIYWLFSSPKGSFNALIYMHRYRPDTVSVVLQYLREYREKLVSERDRQIAVTINPASSQGDKTKAQKEMDRLGKVLAELEDYERDILYPLATEQKAIDLDDGVKKNYLAFGPALKKIPGLEAKDED
jgi:type II restriction/modification system DNA methylase subunit YeeA